MFECLLCRKYLAINNVKLMFSGNVQLNSLSDFVEYKIVKDKKNTYLGMLNLHNNFIYIKLKLSVSMLFVTTDFRMFLF